MSCGTGAVAAVAWWLMRGFAEYGRSYAGYPPGGTDPVRWREEDLARLMDVPRPDLPPPASTV